MKLPAMRTYTPGEKLSSANERLTIILPKVFDKLPPQQQHAVMAFEEARFGRIGLQRPGAHPVIEDFPQHALLAAVGAIEALPGDRAVYIGGGFHTIASGGTAADEILGEIDMVLGYVNVDAFQDETEQSMPANQFLGFTVFEKGMTRVLTSRVAGAQIPVELADAQLRFGGLQTGIIVVTDSTGVRWEMSSPAALAPDIGAILGAYGWPKKPGVEIVDRQAVYLAGVPVLIAAGGTAPINLSPSVRYKARTLVMSGAATALWATAPNVQFGYRGLKGLEITQLEPPLKPLITSTVAGRGIPGSMAAVEAGISLIAEQGKDVMLKPATGIDITIDDETLGDRWVIPTILGTAILSE